MDGGIGRHHARRKDRLVQCTALALYQLAAAHRGWRLPVAATQHHKCQRGISVRHRLAHPIRCPQSLELNQLQRELHLWCVAHHRQPVRQVLSNAENSGRCLPEWIHGLFNSPLGPFGFSAYARRTDRYTRPSQNDRGVQPGSTGLRAAIGNLRLDRIYIGAHGEFSQSNTNGSIINLATRTTASPVNDSLPNWHGGIQLGFYYVTPSRLLFGIEADVVTSGGTTTRTTTDAFGTAAHQVTVFDSETVRGRLGYAFDNVLLYGTGGWAWSSNQYVRTQLTGALNNATAGADDAVNKYLSGWTAGAGISVAFAKNWNAFVEYRYTDFGSTTVALPLSELTTTSTTKISAIDFGVNYKFNANGPGGSALAAADAGLPPRLSDCATRRPLSVLHIAGPGSTSGQTAVTAGKGRPER